MSLPFGASAMDLAEKEIYPRGGENFGFLEGRWKALVGLQKRGLGGRGKQITSVKKQSASPPELNPLPHITCCVDPGPAFICANCWSILQRIMPGQNHFRRCQGITQRGILLIVGRSPWLWDWSLWRLLGSWSEEVTYTTDQGASNIPRER